MALTSLVVTGAAGTLVTGTCRGTLMVAVAEAVEAIDEVTKVEVVFKGRVPFPPVKRSVMLAGRTTSNPHSSGLKVVEGEEVALTPPIASPIDPEKVI